MNVISIKTLVEFFTIQPDSKKWLGNWHKTLNKTTFTDLNHLQQTFSDVEKAGNRYVFNVMGNNYRLVYRITFPKTVFIRGVFTHAEYDRLCFLMEQHNLKQVDMIDIFKSQSIVSDILNGKRNLTVEHIRGLVKRFGVSADVFI